MSEDGAGGEHRHLAALQEYQAALDLVLARPARTLRVFDRVLGEAWNSPARTETLRGFLLRSRTQRLLVVLHETSTLVRDCPRLMDLLRRFSHAISIHETPPQAKQVYDPFVLADERDYVHRFHYDSARGLLALDDPQGALALAHRFEEIWEASTPAVSATTLGL
jgi:hypothetical protein